MAMIKRGKMWYTDDWDGGHRIRRALDKNERVAGRLYEDFRDSLRSRRLGILPKNTSWRNFKEKYLVFRKAERSLETEGKDRTAFKRIEEEEDITRLIQLTPEFLQELKAKWRVRGHSETAIGKYVVSIKTAMKCAERWKYIAPQDWSAVEAHQPPPRLIYYSVEELKALLKECDEPYYTAALLMSRAGLRSGETRHLMMSDIDWDRRTIWIHSKRCEMCRECRHAGNQWHPKGWKPKKPRERYIDMSQDLEDHLRSLRRAQGLVLGPRMVGVSTYQQYFQKLAQNANLKGGAHAFRHTFGAHMVSAGVTLEALGELMGHSDPKTTKIYAHLMPHARRDAINHLPVLGS